ncbi:uncharacterized protein LOC135845684 isoform X3 [Planococcus citri]|uniref:uncharacterized protein LOC135845684 isoform X3 n=1 Tax=Planococcus citri TaxID=170843 RepID=UPI0031F903B5
MKKCKRPRQSRNSCRRSVKNSFTNGFSRNCVRPNFPSILKMSDQRDMPNGSLVFYSHVGELADLAAISSMAVLMNHKITQLRRGNREIDVDTPEIDLIPRLALPLPETVINTIRGLSYQMNVSRMKWWTYHWQHVFFCDMRPDDMIVLLDQLVWLPNGSVSFEQTAKKLLSGGVLTNVQKFQIACTYCFLEDVNLLKETLSQNELNCATKAFQENTDPFLNYWCCKMCRMTGAFNPRRVDLCEFLLPVSRKFYHHWPAIELFWKQIPDGEERLRKLKFIIGISDVELTWRIVPELAKSPLNSVIIEKCFDIVATFAEKYNYIEYTILTWKYLVGLINNDQLLGILLYVTNLQNSRDYVNHLLWEMWLCISERQKQWIADEGSHDFVVKSIENLILESPNYPLIIDILSRWNIERRRNYWAVNWHRLVIGQMNYRNRFEEIMKMCLETEENIAVFKRTVMTDFSSIKEPCTTLLNSKRFEELQDYFDYCTLDQEVIRNLKRQIITTISKSDLFWILYSCCEMSGETEFEKYLEVVFIADEAKVFLNELLVSNLNNIRDLLHEGCINEVIRFVEKFLSGEENLDKVKLEFVKFSRNLINDARVKINVSDWLDLLAWCLDGNRSLMERFKILLQSAEVSDDVEMENPDEHQDHICNSIYESFCNLYLDDECKI